MPLAEPLGARAEAAVPARAAAPPATAAPPLRIAYLLPNIDTPRCLKRIRWLAREGAEATVIAFERTFLGVRARLSDLPYVSLGALDHGRYWQRGLRLLRAVSTVVGHLRGRDVVYCFGLDLLWLGWLGRACLGSRAPLVYEVGDVREVQCGTRLVSRVVRRLERFLLRRTAALVITSPHYLDGYYRRFEPLPPVFLIENKFGHDTDPKLIEAVRATPVCREPGVITIGYFGNIRCERSLDLLFELAERAEGRIRVDIRGIGLTEAIRRRLDGAPAHVTVGGPYRPEADMPEMFRRIDLGWAAYYHAATNARMARSNRFYDCCAFGRPLIAQKGSPDGLVVEQRDLGLIIDAGEREGAMRAMLELTPARIAAWRANVLALPRRLYIHEPGDEHADLVRFLAEGGCATCESST